MIQPDTVATRHLSPLHYERSYLALLHDLVHMGNAKADRTGTGTRSFFGWQLRIDLRPDDKGQPIPLLTTKQINWKTAVHELVWFISGNESLDYLQQNGVHIWDNWADENNTVKGCYGKQWRAFRVADDDSRTRDVDQLQSTIEAIKRDPCSRRHVISAWHPGEIQDMGLPPCHTLFQFYVLDRRLSCHLYMRSTDVFLGLPFSNIWPYALLTILIAELTMTVPEELIISTGDIHLYNNHIAQARQQLEQEVKPMPYLVLDGTRNSIDDFHADHVRVIDYHPGPAIRAPIAV